jgi:zinc transporter ZupT
MAVPAFLLVEWFRPLLPVGLGFAAGAMAWMVAAQLLPDALRTTRPLPVAAATAASAAAMIALQLALLG